MKILSKIDRLMASAGDDGVVVFSLWDRTANGGNGGMRFGEIYITIHGLTKETKRLSVTIGGSAEILRLVDIEKSVTGIARGQGRN